MMDERENSEINHEGSETIKGKDRTEWFERVEPMFTSGRRDWSVDVLRCVSCFLVCAIHATNGTFLREIGSSGPNPWLHHEVYRMLFASPTVLFVMVSGIFFLSPERNVTAPKVWKKNVIKMAFAYIFWSLIYALYRIYIMDPRPEFTWELVSQEWIEQPAHLWYIPMIIGLYIICPILRPITATYDKKLFAYITCIFMGGLILWTMYYWPTGVNPEGSPEVLTTKQTILTYTPMGLICQFPMWMLFGWIAYTYRPNRKLRLIIYGIGIAATIVGMHEAVKLGATLEDHFITALTQKFSIFSFLKNVALFYFIITVFRDHKFSPTGQKLLRKLSDNTLIIYLVHYLILKILYDNNILYSSGMSPWAGVWLYSIIAYVAGGLLATVFHLFWDPVNKALFAKKKRSERFYDKLEKKSG